MPREGCSTSPRSVCGQRFIHSFTPVITHPSSNIYRAPTRELCQTLRVQQSTELTHGAIDHTPPPNCQVPVPWWVGPTKPPRRDITPHPSPQKLSPSAWWADSNPFQVQPHLLGPASPGFPSEIPSSVLGPHSPQPKTRATMALHPTPLHPEPDDKCSGCAGPVSSRCLSTLSPAPRVPPRQPRAWPHFASPTQGPGCPFWVV